MKICIDPGHSGAVEPGACAGGITEAAINLQIALRLGRRLREMGHEVIYTREAEIDTKGLAFRADIANDNGADTFVSVHCNGSVLSTARGWEVFHYPGSVDGRRLANAIAQAAAEYDTVPFRGVKEADFAVLRLTTMPSVLVECAFLTNDQDRVLLTGVSEEAPRSPGGLDQATAEDVSVEAAENVAAQPACPGCAGVGGQDDGQLPPGMLGNVPKHKQRPWHSLLGRQGLKSLLGRYLELRQSLGTA